MVKKTKEKKNPVGRPRVTLDDFPLNWKETVLDAYSNGACDVEVRMLLPITGSVMSNTLFYDLLEREEEFSEIVKEGQALSYVWHMKAGRQGMFMGKDFNTAVWFIMMKNRFGWQDKVEVVRREVREVIIKPIFGENQLESSKAIEHESSS